MISADLTWEPQRGRWRKKYRGKVYVVSCQALGAPETKVGSYKAANAWWVQKRAEIDSNAPTTPVPSRKHPHAAILDQLGERLEWAKTNGDTEAARVARESISEVRDLPEGDESLADLALGGDQGRAVWRDRLQRRSAPQAKDRSVGFQVARWVALQKVKAQAGEIVPAESENRRHAITTFETWIGGETLVGRINESKWTDWYTHLLGLVSEAKVSRSYADKLLRCARQFLDWLDSEGVMLAPRNLNKLRIRQRSIAVETLEVDEVRKLLGNATGATSLHILLMINCGFTQQDISDLKPSEVVDGCIVRKRSKTRDHQNVPEVRYRLWPETLEALEARRSTDPDRLFLTQTGQPWVRKEFRNGKFVESDSIRTLYSRLARKCGIKLSMKHFRKSSATLIDQNPQFGDRIATLFLGHSPRSIKDRHYTRVADDALTPALDWLHDQYFPPVAAPSI